MDALDLSRWQFGITTVYHFIFVPLTIGLSALVAGLQTAWVRTGKEHYLRATRFWGKLFLINFAIGVVTGIVQEFQFGMNWSAYSRFVGDIFGAPLAIEGLLAFFLESTFLGLWIFGWDRLPKKVHLATIWTASIGTMLSAYFILAANSWMQHPVGWTMGDGRAELTSIGAVLTNSTTLVTVPHTLTACFLTAGAMLLAVSAWHLRRDHQSEVFRPSLRLGAWVVLIAGVGVLITGDIQARVMTEQQPMKMAAAEALYETTDSASFSLFTIGSLNGDEELYSVRIPSLLSFMATGSPSGEVEGINDVQAEYEQTYGAGDYRPIVPVTYWSFRLMIGFGGLAMLIAAAALWFNRGERRSRSRWLWIAAVSTVAMPLLANSFGWIFTEMGRQPWTVFGLFKTSESGSPSVSTAEAATGLIVLTVLYGILAVIEFGLFIKYAKAGAPALEPDTPDSEDKPLAFAY
ncbi:cytochrome d ubiquinol oxidase subunit I [Actinoplanes lutulentus]|uniref:Cytochrome bd-I ubiquinol oxidase subunit 1 apoprotein n=1 Tax=Actinoplanes lutulentus TaxID=1287878 RepID=A0A327Z8P4_9ACTN|nr:cytochrome ubiquinol oxidase subunit I [Actinoplanes lutulentus]MBB2943642.1 cytochrome d ubiquinol oxidase subunit I [Actinoplanes lutulentus]RAK27507.1 cytochrome bd-I ubiquinol oxidase subunit 1 apoprotein [Actinoplanes lutulentus]